MNTVVLRKNEEKNINEVKENIEEQSNVSWIPFVVSRGGFEYIMFRKEVKEKKINQRF